MISLLVFSICSLDAAVELPTLPAHSCEQKGSRSAAGKSKKEVVTKHLQWHQGA